MPIVIRPCTKKAGFEAIPVDAATDKWDQERRLDMGELTKVFHGMGWEVTDARIVIVVKGPDTPEVTVYPTGRLIIKTDDEATAEAVAGTVLRAIGLE